MKAKNLKQERLYKEALLLARVKGKKDECRTTKISPRCIDFTLDLGGNGLEPYPSETREPAARRRP